MFATVRINTPLESIEPFRSVATKSGRVTLASASGENAQPQYEFPVVPERAVIDTGAKKVVYVEREPGIFEGVEVELGPRDGQYYPVLKGIGVGDKVAAAGGFLIDAETRLNPAAASTYFGASGGPQSSSGSSMPSAPVQRPSEPSPPHQGKPDSRRDEAKPKVTIAEPSAEELKNIEQLPEADRKLAIAQRICPVTGALLGSMGVPVKITLRDQPVFLCCQGCVAKAKRSPDETLKKLVKHDRQNH
jgi:membrane fusion protein, copper/silver efflux system